MKTVIGISFLSVMLLLGGLGLNAKNVKQDKKVKSCKCGKHCNKVKSDSSDTLQLFGNQWTAYEIASRLLDMGQESMPYMIFAKDGMVNGFSGCNRFFGNCGLDGESLSFGNMGMTKMMCMGDANQVEMDFTSALQSVNNYKIIGGILILYNDTVPMLKLKVMNE